MSGLRCIVNDLRFITTRQHDPKKKYSFTFKLLMAIDALGLLLIALCTIAEALEDWDLEFRDHFFGNRKALFFWVLGVVLATLGLIAIVFNCAAMEKLPYMEHVGMFMLTVAPVVNCIGWYFLETGDLLDNYTLVATEVLEFIGMNVLNYSYWCDTHWTDCFVEVTGYCVLACAAMLDIFVYPEDLFHPMVVLRRSTVNRMDVLGLIALMVVSIGKYQMHLDGISEYSNDQDSNLLEMMPGMCVASNNETTPVKRKDYND